MESKKSQSTIEVAQTPPLGQMPVKGNQNEFYDDQELVNHYKELIIYKCNLQKVDSLLQNEDDEETIQELKQIREELLPGIEIQIEKIKQSQPIEQFIYSVDPLEPGIEGRLCKAFHFKDKKWYHAKIIAADAESQEIEIQFIGYSEIVSLHSIFIKIMPVPDVHSFFVGSQCEAIYQGDGKYYQCVIEAINDLNYILKFKKLNIRETSSLYFLRDSKKNDPNQAQKKLYSNEDQLNIPDHIKINPTDSLEDRLSKKKKIKNMKQNFKQNQLEKISIEKQKNWRSFNEDASTKQLGAFRKLDNCFKRKAEEVIERKEVQKVRNEFLSDYYIKKNQF